MECCKENDKFCDTCIARKNKFSNYICKKTNVSVATLGPDGTTSSEAAKVLRNYISDINRECSLEIILKDSFEVALAELHDGNVDFILLPNAYGNMTHFYWDFDIELVLSFINSTPKYGIAALEIEKLYSKEKLKIATCKPVEHLVSNMLDSTSLRDKNYEILIENSTKKSLMLMEDNKADLALTNDTSLVGSKAYFISETQNTEVLWSVFMNRK